MTARSQLAPSAGRRPRAKAEVSPLGVSDPAGMLGPWHAKRAAKIDEQLLIGIERSVPGEEREREIAPAPEILSA